MKLHQEILNGFQVTERTRLECKFCYFPFQRAITPKICNPELWFLCSARCLMLINNPVKFHKDTLNGSQFTEQTPFVTPRRTDDPCKNNLSPTTKGNDIKMKSWHVCQFSNVVLNKIKTEFFKLIIKTFFFSFIRICSNA